MKKGSRYLGFYSLVMALNIAVGAMFLIVSTPAPLPPVMDIVYPAAPPRIVPAISGTPNRIVIPSLGIDLPVGVGSYDQASGEWTLSSDRAYYADVSVPANDSNGVTLIYGHAQTPIFARLIGLQSGAQADVYTDNGRIFHYRYQSVENVVPTDISIFHSDGPPTLVLQTCAGSWDTYRAMYSFALVNEVQL